MINVSEKFMELLNPFMDELGIKEIDIMQEICNRLITDKAFKKIISRNIIKEELFEDMTYLSNKLKQEILENIPSSISKLSIREFSKACRLLPKVFVDISNICTRKYYAFEIQLNENNDENLIIFNKETNEKIITVYHIALKKLISDIVNIMDNKIFHLSEKNIPFDLYSADENVKEKVTIELNLEEMIEILNYYTISVNTKFSKVLNKNFVFKVEDEDSLNQKDYKEKYPNKNIVKGKENIITYDYLPEISTSSYTTPHFTNKSNKGDSGFTKLSDIE